MIMNLELGGCGNNFIGCQGYSSLIGCIFFIFFEQGHHSHNTGINVIAKNVTIIIPMISNGNPALAIFPAVT